MAHPIATQINKLEKMKAVACNETCKYWHFPHRDTACVLSDVFSVRKGQPCYEYQAKTTNTGNR